MAIILWHYTVSDTLFSLLLEFGYLCYFLLQGSTRRLAHAGAAFCPREGLSPDLWFGCHKIRSTWLLPDDWLKCLPSPGLLGRSQGPTSQQWKQEQRSLCSQSLYPSCPPPAGPCSFLRFPTLFRSKTCWEPRYIPLKTLSHTEHRWAVRPSVFTLVSSLQTLRTGEVPQKWVKDQVSLELGKY